MDETAQIPRRDAWYAQLSEEERWAVYEKAVRLGATTVIPWVEKTHGIAVSRSAFYRFLDWMRPQLSAHRLEQAVLARTEAERLAKAGGMKKTIAEAFVTMANEAALGTGDAAAGKDWVDMAAKLIAAVQKDREIELRAEAQRLDREKFEAAQRREDAAKETIADAKLSPEEREARLRAIFGM